MEKASASQRKGWRNLVGWVLVGILILVMAYYIGSAMMDDFSVPQRLVVYAFSTQEEVFSQGIFPVFERTC